MPYADRATYQLHPGDTILVHRSGPQDATVWPALTASHSETVTVLDPPLLHVDPSWYDDTVQLATLNTSGGPCLVSISFRWLTTPAAPALAA